MSCNNIIILFTLLVFKISWVHLFFFLQQLQPLLVCFDYVFIIITIKHSLFCEITTDSSVTTM